MDMGFISAGFDVVWSNEIDGKFANFYKEGITNWKHKRGLINTDSECNISNQNSINDITPRNIIKEAFNNKRPDMFGIIGGPPCQDFSVNGNLDGFHGDRGSLTDAYLYKIMELQPAFFIMENVTGLIRVKKNAEHFFDLIKIMQEDYLIDWDVLNSIEFDVPQSRERIFVVGLNKNFFNLSAYEQDKKWFPFNQNKKHIGALKNFKWPGSIPFGSSPKIPSEIPLNLCVESCLVPKASLNEVPNSDEYFNLRIDKNILESIKEGETNRPSFKRLHRYKFSPTTCYGNNEVHLHPYLHRRLSVREAFRIQGVEDSYILTTKGLLSKKFKMIGNGVPVPMAKGLAKSLLNFIKNLPLKNP